jgi:hypothetical protein
MRSDFVIDRQPTHWAITLNRPGRLNALSASIGGRRILVLRDCPGRGDFRFPLGAKSTGECINHLGDSKNEFAQVVPLGSNVRELNYRTPPCSKDDLDATSVEEGKTRSSVLYNLSQTIAVLVATLVTYPDRSTEFATKRIRPVERHSVRLLSFQRSASPS